MGRKEQSITLSLSLEDKALLEQLAIAHDCKWGEKPNVSRLMQRIASGNLKISNLNAEEQKVAEIKSLMRSPEILRLQAILSLTLPVINGEDS
jgi:hypothetical protein